MFRTRPVLAMPQALFIARTTFKLALGLLFLSFFFTYQPTFGFPPLKTSAVHAQAEQSQNVASQALPITFQLPHPGYLSTHFSSWHPGIDIPTGFGMPIHPIAEGTIINTQFNFFGYGMMIEVDHGYGYQSLYAHMNRIYVKNGDHVSKDSILGEVGLTGRTTGPHTHLEVSKDGVKINPLTILPPIRQAPEAQDFVSYDKVSSESAKIAISSQISSYQGGPTKLPTLGNTKIQPNSTPTPEIKKDQPRINSPLSLSDNLDVGKMLSTPTPIKPDFLNL